MNKDLEFFERVKTITDPKIEEGINSGNPYTICDILEKTQGGPNGIYLRKLENVIIATNDVVQIYEFMFLAIDMNILNFDRERFEKIIRDSNNPKLMCYCMEFAPGTNIRTMLLALENTKNAKYMEMIINNEEYSDVLKEVKEIDPQFEEKLEKAKEFNYYPESLKQFLHLKDNIPNLKKEVIESKNPHLITELANYIEYLNEYKGESYDLNDLAIAQGQLKDPMQAYEFLASVNSINVECKNTLIQVVANSGMPKFMYYVYEYVPELTESEKKQIKESIMKQDSTGKYRKMVEDTVSISDRYLESKGE